VLLLRPRLRRATLLQGQNRETRMRVLLWIVGIIFLIGLLVVTGFLKLIF
jgi:hypothetical protein